MLYLARVRAGFEKQLGRPRIDPALEKRVQTQLRAGKGILRFDMPSIADLALLSSLR